VPNGVLLINLKTMEIEFSNREMDSILYSITVNTADKKLSVKDKLKKFLMIKSLATDENLPAPPAYQT
jgi:hypothetical protein